jgi:hypothetical protein
MPAMAEMILELYYGNFNEKDIIKYCKIQKLNGNHDKYEVILTRDKILIPAFRKEQSNQ